MCIRDRSKNLTSYHFRRTHRPTPATRPAPRPPHTSRQLLTHLAEDLAEEVLHGRPAAALGDRVVLRSMLGRVDTRDREGVYGTGVAHDLPVEAARLAQLVLERRDSRVRHDGVARAREHQQRGADRLRRARLPRLQPAMERHDAGEVGTGPGELQNGGPAEAVADRTHPSAVHGRFGAKPFESGW